VGVAHCHPHHFDTVYNFSYTHIINPKEGTMKDLENEVFSRMTDIEEFDENYVVSIAEAITALSETNPIVSPGFYLGQQIARQAIMTGNKRMYDAASTVLWFIGVLNMTDEGVSSHEDAMEWSDWGWPLAVKEYENALNTVINEQIGDI